MILPGWIIYFGTPFYNIFLLDDNKNLDKKVDKTYLKSQMFVVPLYTYIFGFSLSLIYCLLLFSTKYRIDHWIFDIRPETNMEYLVFGAVFSFFGAVSSLAGHELVHHKQWYHKLVGDIPYSQAFYSHFWDEHTTGHHKYIATDADPVCHKKGSNLYTGLVTAVIGTHTSTWKRENDRIQKRYPDKELSTLFYIS